MRKTCARCEKRRSQVTAATKQDIQKAFMLLGKYVREEQYKYMPAPDVFDDVCRRVVEELENNNV